jgi:flagellar basal body P-ring protein FlgI
MNINNKTIRTVITIIVSTGLFFVGCEEQERTRDLASEIDLGTTIGSLVEIFSLRPIPVEGYAIVGGLNKTGSSECPPELRGYLEQYILRQMREPKVNIGAFINSHDTAVVQVRGLIPALASKNQRFDIQVAALSGTQTTSLEGGWLYGAELKAAGGFDITIKVLARAEGAVFIDKIDNPDTNKRVGHILGGGIVLDDYMIGLSLRKPDFATANLIRNRLNERFGEATAKAVSESLIELTIPARYNKQKERFISIVKLTYLNQNPEITKERITTYIRKLAVSQDEESEIALETIGKESLRKLGALLNSSVEEVRLRAARCILNLGSDKGLEVLRQITMDEQSSYRPEALEAITAAAKRNDAASIARRLLRDKDFEIRLAAYESLKRVEDISITRKIIAGNFYLEQIAQTDYKAVFVSRSGSPQIALFGVPIYCRENTFVQSTDSDITIHTPAGEQYVSIIRKHPTRPNVILKLKSSFELSDIIEKLCEEPAKRGDREQGGLNVSYSDAIALLKQMSDKGAIVVEFRAGPLPKSL